MAWSIHKSFVAVGALAVFAIAPEASAQTDPSPRLMISSWIKSCSQYSFAYAAAQCRVRKDVFESGELIGSFVVFEADMRGPKAVLIFSVRRDVALKDNARLIVDRNQPLSAQTINCTRAMPAEGGTALYCEAGTNVLNRLKIGQVLTMEAVQKNGRPFSMQIDLKEFASVYDGPPTDLKALLAQQIKLQSEPQKPIRDDTLQPHLRPKN